MKVVNKHLAAVRTSRHRGTQGFPQAWPGFVKSCPLVVLKVLRRKEGLIKILKHTGISNMNGVTKDGNQVQFRDRREESAGFFAHIFISIHSCANFLNLTCTCVSSNPLFNKYFPTYYNKPP